MIPGNEVSKQLWHTLVETFTLQRSSELELHDAFNISTIMRNRNRPDPMLRMRSSRLFFSRSLLKREAQKDSIDWFAAFTRVKIFSAVMGMLSSWRMRA